MIDDLLAQAGRAGRDAFIYEGDSPSRTWEDEDYIRLARAVLATLGIEWDGQWEWRVVWAAGFNWKAGLAEAQARKVQSQEGGRLQRRPKVTVTWRDVPEI